MLKEIKAAAGRFLKPSVSGAEVLLAEEEPFQSSFKHIDRSNDLANSGVIKSVKDLEKYFDQIEDDREKELLASQIFNQILQHPDCQRILVNHTGLFIVVLTRHLKQQKNKFSYSIDGGEEAKEKITSFWRNIGLFTREAILSKLLFEVIADIPELRLWFFNNTSISLSPIIERENPKMPYFVSDFKKLIKTKPESIIPLESIQSRLRGLSFNQKPSIMLTGPTGIGKSAQIKSFVQNSMNDPYHPLHNSDVLYLDLGLLFEKTETRGKMEEKINQLIHYAKKTGAFFIVDEVHGLFNYSDSGNELPPREIFKTAIDNGDIKLITSTNMFEEISKIDEAIGRRMHIVEMENPTETELNEILDKIFQKKDITFVDDSVKKQLLKQLYKTWSDPSLSLVVKILKISERLPRGYQLNQENCTQLLLDMSISQIEHLNIPKFETALNQTVIGQEQAKAKIIEIFQSLKVSPRIKGPLAIFTFLGPTGVGKSLTAETVARLVYGRENFGQKHILRIDGNTYKETTSVAKLYGTAPGYVGYNSKGATFNFILEHPASVVIIEEIEKMHEDAVDSLLQILQEGRVKMGNGQEIDFSQTIIVFTSNALQVDSKSVSMTDAQEELVNKFPHIFKPEMLGRMSEGMVIFDHLEKNDFARILEKELIVLSNTIANEFACQITFSDKLKRILLEKFLVSPEFNKSLGAREMSSKLMTGLKSRIALKIKQMKEAPNLQCDWGDDQDLLVFEVNQQLINQFTESAKVLIKKAVSNKSIPLYAPNETTLNRFAFEISKTHQNSQETKPKLELALKALNNALKDLPNNTNGIVISINLEEKIWVVENLDQKNEQVQNYLDQIEMNLKKEYRIKLTIDQTVADLLIKRNIGNPQGLKVELNSLSAFLKQNVKLLKKGREYSLSIEFSKQKEIVWLIK